MGKFSRLVATACLTAGAIYAYNHPEEVKFLAKTAYNGGKEFAFKVYDAIQNCNEYASHPEKCGCKKASDEDLQQIMDEFAGFDS